METHEVYTNHIAPLRFRFYSNDYNKQSRLSESTSRVLSMDHWVLIEVIEKYFVLCHNGRNLNSPALKSKRKIHGNRLWMAMGMNLRRLDWLSARFSRQNTEVRRWIRQMAIDWGFWSSNFDFHLITILIYFAVGPVMSLGGLDPSGCGALMSWEFLFVYCGF